ncbi:MAG: bifunctional pyr operon transcriptional regulator/uracil phosphoribosyltransferase PyrR, partial [Oceanobacter sp.]
QQLAIDTPLYSVDISFYLDDFTRNGLHPQVKGSELPDSIEDRHIILIDDVIMSGRTTRAAINELFDYGRPASITLACLIDIGQRELPFQPDIVAVRLQLASNERIKISGPDPLDISIVNNH